MTEALDGIDRDDRVVFKEQAYGFETLDKNSYKIKLAVLDPEPLLPYPSVNTVQGFLKNVDRICEIGRKQQSFQCIRKSDFLTDYASGMRFLHSRTYRNKESAPEYLLYSAQANFNGCSGELNPRISDYNIKINPELAIEPELFGTYGVVYSMDGEEETPNIVAARAFEISGRKHVGFNRQYNYVGMMDNQYDTLGRFVVWGAGLVIKKAASLYGLDNALPFLTTLSSEEMHYKSIKNHFQDTQKIFCSRLTTPLSDPIDLFHNRQTKVKALTGYPMLGPKETEKLAVQLQERNNNYVSGSSTVKRNLPTLLYGT